MVRRLIRVAAATLAIALAGAPTAAAEAVPRPNINVQWWFDSWAIEQLVWPATKGRGVTVAVIDTGVNAQLPDLQGVLLPGKNFLGGGNVVRRDTDEEKFGHGTGMISLIAAQGGRTGFVGLAPEAKVLPIVANTGEDTIGPAVRYAADQGAKVINISKGASAGNIECPPGLQAAVVYAAKKDAIVVASAGNSGNLSNFPEYPASCPGVVGVGAIDNQGAPWEQTQRQDYVVMAAPGVGISAISRDGRVWGNGEGTSQAAALASGAFALVRSRFPDMSAREVVQLVTNTTVDVGPKGRDDMTGFGAISLRRALREKVPASAPNPVYERLDKVMAQSSPGSSGAPSSADDGDDGGSGNLTLILVVGLVLVGIAVVGVPISIARDRKKKRGRDQPPPPGGGPGTPPSFGAPPGGQPPYTQAPYGPPSGPQPPYPPHRGG
ncbi:type VII secretion-associated serine protease mycosin [Thermomonospora echinospora]|uniref:Type VII secretion-associated serine protease mycosin n=1 Tax=Thermomonospora echinospora TaxID=1992 RepID=A0A1H6D2A5_9ACTN|nr:S8 family serine peptidase [Thermomonospora echinospora]SEG79400.1 type VII secretion-associated serine protease mycosin [Thermomonospora echinospora]